MSDDYETHELELAFQAGAASRDAEVARLEQENDQLRAQINVLREALKNAVDTIEWIDNCTTPAQDEIDKQICIGVRILATTPEQSLVEYRNKVIEECAAALNVAITRMSSCRASIKNDVAISTIKEQSCKLRAMKEQP